jgi:hypothetical protein
MVSTVRLRLSSCAEALSPNVMETIKSNMEIFIFFIFLFFILVDEFD